MTLSNPKLQLANAWLSKGKLALAEKYYREVLATEPNNDAARSGLGRVAFESGDLETAEKHFEQALRINPECLAAKALYGAATEVWLTLDETQASVTPPPNVPAKLCMGDDIFLNYHRSGWKYVLETLRPLSKPDGILFDGFLEYNFLAKHLSDHRSPAELEYFRNAGVYDYWATSEEKGIVPYRRPWVGVVHNPPNMPTDIDYYNVQTLQHMLAKDIWQESLALCRGLFTLSEYNAKWIREATGMKVSVLTFPTEIPESQFSLDRFLQNERPKIVQIGWWLRRLNSIYALPLPADNAMRYQKAWLMPKGNRKQLRSLLTEEQRRAEAPVETQFADNTTEIDFLSNDEYDRLLTENIVFIDLYDSSANNVIVESVARATPVLVNPLPPVREYLGDDYPLYFSSLSEAAEKAMDADLIAAANEHLRQSPVRKKFDAEVFLRSFVDSEVYRSL